jgi:rhodanese-related sulfurtransferase
MMKQISYDELRSRLTNQEDIYLVDVREPHEHEAFNIGGVLIPLTELLDHLDQIPKDKEVVLYCKMGVRSQIAIQRLERFGYTNLVNLSGGVEKLRR